MPRDWDFHTLVGQGRGGCRRGLNDPSGYPATDDPWSRWMDEYYGGLHISAASNIVFSNGLLDPWSSGGVLRNLSTSAVALILPNGAHHLDLMFPTPADPPDAVAARRTEELHIRKWISEAYARTAHV